VRINWNGLPPHLENTSPAIREMIDGADARRAQYEETKSTNIYNDQRSATNGNH